jgi:SAM-dependent methyltransferase
MTDQAFWDNKWKQGQTGWDLKGVSPAIKLYIDSITDKNLRILIPGCGNAYEAEYLLTQDFNHVTVIDIAPTLINQLSAKLKPYIEAKKLHVVCGDFFEQEATFDIIIEQTFFCAINPKQRVDYVKHMHKLLNPGGKLVGLLFNTEFNGGPPFGGNTKEYIAYFKTHFQHISFSPCINSITPRAGKEVWMEIEK